MSERPESSDCDEPRLAIRRWGDGCFHPVEEEVAEGYIVDGILIPRDEVTQVIEFQPDQPPPCPRGHSGPHSS